MEEGEQNESAIARTRIHVDGKFHYKKISALKDRTDPFYFKR